MGGSALARPLILSGKGLTTRAADERTIVQETVERLMTVTRSIVDDEPVQVIATKVLEALYELFGLDGLVLRVTDKDLDRSLSWAILGFSEEQAQGMMSLMTSDRYRVEVLQRQTDDEHRVCGNAYFIGAEDWWKLLDEDPWWNDPVFFRDFERGRAPRESPDQWHESDTLRYIIPDEKGEIIAWLEANYTADGRKPSRQTIELAGSFADLVGLVLLRERRRLTDGSSATKVSRRSELLEDVLKISSSIVSERDVKNLSGMILRSVASVFGFRKVALIVHEEAHGAFKWVGLFGYGGEAVRDAKMRTVPTDVVLEDLRDERRMGKSAYFTPAEEITALHASHWVVPQDSRDPRYGKPRDPLEYRRNDRLAFALHDSSGRIAGVLYPSEPESGAMPDQDTIDTMEVFTSLAEVAIENARLVAEREQALRLSSQRTEQLSRILDMTSDIMHVRDLDQMLDSLLKTLAQLSGIKRMTFGVKNESKGVYEVLAVYGFSEKFSKEIMKENYEVDEVDSILDTSPARSPDLRVKWRKKVGRWTYYMPAEGLTIVPSDWPYYPEPELVRLPRRGAGYWHELDYTDTFIMDKNGSPIAYLEILKPRDDRIPDQDTIEIVEIFANLAGIAIENSRLLQEHIDSRRDSELYTDVLSHDIKNFNQAILGYLDLLKAKEKSPEYLALLQKISDQVMNTSWLASNIRTISQISFGRKELTRMDVGAVLDDCMRSLSHYYPGRNIVWRSNAGRNQYYVDADELIREICTNILTNAVKYDSHDPLELDVLIEPVVKDARKYWVIGFGDRGRGIPDDVKPMIFDRFSKAPSRKGSGMGLHIVKTLALRYGGRVWVEDRVAGDYSQGIFFKLELPAAK